MGLIFHDAETEAPEHEHEWVVLHHYGEHPDGEGLVHYCPTGFVWCAASGPELDKDPNDSSPGTPVEWACHEWDSHNKHPDIPLCERWGE